MPRIVVHLVITHSQLVSTENHRTKWRCPLTSDYQRVFVMHCIYIYIYVYVYVCVYVYMCICSFVSLYLCIYVSMYVM